MPDEMKKALALERNGHDKLLADLKAKPDDKARNQLLTRAEAFEFHEDHSASMSPITDLVLALKAVGYDDLADKANAGEYNVEIVLNPTEQKCIDTYGCINTYGPVLPPVITHVPEGVLLKYVRNATQQKEKEGSRRRIISVGSGNGQVEYRLRRDLLLKQEVICIDPAPESYVSFVPSQQIKPQFDTVATFVKECKEAKEIASQSCLLLNWCSNNASAYDLEALSTLKPATAVIVYGQRGEAGSPKMRGWLESLQTRPLQKPPNMDSLDWELLQHYRMGAYWFHTVSAYSSAAAKSLTDSLFPANEKTLRPSDLRKGIVFLVRSDVPFAVCSLPCTEWN